MELPIKAFLDYFICPMVIVILLVDWGNIFPNLTHLGGTE